MAQSTTVRLGQALRAARETRGMLQADVGRVACLDHSMISSIERGTRRMARDVAQRVAVKLDCGRLAIALCEDVTGGSESPLLDGPAVDLSRAATWAKGLEELEEELAAGRQAMTVVLRAPAAVGEPDRRMIREALLEMAEAVTAVRHVLAVACEEYQISHRGIWDQHRRELRASGYLASA